MAPSAGAKLPHRSRTYPVSGTATACESTTNGVGRGGRYPIRADGTTYATLNNGGPEFQFVTNNGRILLRKK